jgi:hypothetical protein
MKTVTLRYSDLEDKRFHLDHVVMEKFFADHNLTEEEALAKPMLEIMGSPFNMGTYLHSATGPAYVLIVKEDCTDAKGNKLTKGQVVHEQYWFEGKRLTGAEESEFIHSLRFGKKFQDLVND